MGQVETQAYLDRHRRMASRQKAETQRQVMAMVWQAQTDIPYTAHLRKQRILAVLAVVGLFGETKHLGMAREAREEKWEVAKAERCIAHFTQGRQVHTPGKQALTVRAEAAAAEVS